MKDSIDNLMRKFTYDDKRISHLLGMFDDNVRFIRDYDDQFDLGSTEHDKSMLAGYRNSCLRYPAVPASVGTHHDCRLPPSDACP